MPRDDFYMPTDMDALRMENELLTFEVRFLKAQLSAREAEHERSATQLQSRLEESERSTTQLQSRLEESERRLEESERRLEESERRLEESEHSAAQLRNRLAEAERAEQDLLLLLRRLANSPLGWFLMFKQNFRILEQRYLDTDA